jgi:hypothetical protein
MMSVSELVHGLVPSALLGVGAVARDSNGQVIFFSMEMLSPLRKCSGSRGFGLRRRTSVRHPLESDTSDHRDRLCKNQDGAESC